MFDAREFRRSLAAFATGVAIVTTTDGNGLRARAWRHSRAKYFAINVLTADQRELSQRFSSTVGRHEPGTHVCQPMAHFQQDACALLCC